MPCRVCAYAILPSAIGLQRGFYGVDVLYLMSLFVRGILLPLRDKCNIIDIIEEVMKKIVVFNHKGGVSKTTTTFHIGWMLADMGHRVLLVDGDPQCNLSLLFLGAERFDAYYENDETRLNNIKDGVASAFNGIPEPIKSFDCPVAERNNNLFLLPGHMNLSENEPSLSLALTSPGAFPTLKSLPGSFNRLIEKNAEKYEIDYVLIDLNPALSSINQVLFLTGDAFLIPINPDVFAVMALKSLSKILPSWVYWNDRNRPFFEDAPYQLPASPPQFLGILSQRFNIRNGLPTKPFEKKLAEIEELVNNMLVPAFSDEHMLFPNEKYGDVGLSKSKELMKIKDFQGLAPKCQQYKVPVFALSDEELEASGAALDGMTKNREVFKKMYEEVCEKVISLLE